MNKTIAIVVLLLGLAAIGGVKYYSLEQSDELTSGTSDAGNFSHQLSIGVDSWAGYYPLCSKYMRSSLRNQGILLRCVNDNADLEQRFAKLKRGELDLAVSTVDAYLTVGKNQQYPGTIVTVIDESKGGDALVCHQEMVSSIDELKQQPNIRVAYTANSPSEHLLRALAVHFDVALFQQTGNWRVPSDGSAAALKLLQQQQVDCAVLWEPDVTKALAQENLQKIIGSEDTEKLIVDVLLASRKLVQQQPALIETLLASYFDTLSYYRQNPQILASELSKEADVPVASAQNMLNGVRFVSLSENVVDWYSSQGNSRHEYLTDAIDSAINILQQSQVLSANPLPNADAYSIMHSAFVTKLFNQQNQGADSNPNTVVNSFSKLNAQQWQSLSTVGTLKVRNVQFSRSSSDLSLDAKRMLDAAAQDISHYPNFRILIQGHTGTMGDAAANEQLSAYRAKAVQRYLAIVHGIDENRMLAIGVGSAQPLAQQAGESQRAYQARLPRVELVLKAGDR